jgi:hypothetical protein
LVERHAGVHPLGRTGSCIPLGLHNRYVGTGNFGCKGVGRGGSPALSPLAGLL